MKYNVIIQDKNCMVIGVAYNCTKEEIKKLCKEQNLTIFCIYKNNVRLQKKD